MSTRGSVIYYHGDDFTFHLYHETHDDTYHMELKDNSNSYINAVIPEHMVAYFKIMMKDHVT